MLFILQGIFIIYQNHIIFTLSKFSFWQKIERTSGISLTEYYEYDIKALYPEPHVKYYIHGNCVCHRHPGTWSNEYQWETKTVTCSFGVDGSDIIPITRNTETIINFMVELV